MRSPYKGLLPYTEEDQPYFFGRDGEREIVSANLKASRLTVLYGASGVGKSSVLRAGVVHDINEEAARRVKRHRQPEFVAVYCQDWREDPAGTIAASLRHSWTQVGLEPPSSPLSGLHALLSNHSRALKAAVLLILDQFEEYLYYQGARDSAGSIDQGLAEVLADRELKAHVLISLREDALAKLDQYKGRISSLFDNFLRIENLDLSAARAAVVQPVKTFCRLESITDIEVEPELVEAVVEQVRTGRLSFHESTDVPAGVVDSDRVETPYLQLVLSRIWDEEITAESRVLRRETLRRLGESSSIVKNHLDTTMSVFTEEERQTAERIFFHLVTPSRTKIAHAVSDLAEFANLEEGRVQEFVAKLASPEHRILRAVPALDPLTGFTRYEIYHDALADAILDWQRRFHARVKEDQIAAALAERERKARERNEREREAERIRHQRTLAWVSLAIALFCLGLSVLAFWYARRAQEERALAQKATARIRNSLLIRQAALDGDQKQLSRLLGQLEQDAHVVFHAKADDLKYKNPDGKEVYRFSMQPDKSSLPVGDNKVAFITYLADHPSFRNSLVTTGARRDFVASYAGWSCLPNVTALVEYADPEHPPTVSEFSMCDLLDRR